MSPVAPISRGSGTLRVAVFGDAGNSITNGTSFYYSPGEYRRYDLGSSGPLQQAVAAMMRSWGPSDVFQLGDESYNVNSSTLLDYNIGQYYNDWMYPYAPPAYVKTGSIYTDGELGGVHATVGRKQWPYNLYDYPNGFPNPSDPSIPGGSADGVNHYYAVAGNHDQATVLGSYNDASVNQVDFNKLYIDSPTGPDAFDFGNNINTPDPPPNNDNFKDNKAIAKIGSVQQLLDYHSYLGPDNPGNLKPGSLNVGKLDPDGYGIYYSIDLGDNGYGKPLLHVTIIDTSRLLTDAGYYDFNFKAKTGPDPGYDVTSLETTVRRASFQPPDLSDDAPSVARQMFLWAQADLAHSQASWNIVMGHHPAYHPGNAKTDDDDSYSSNAVVLNFLKGLQGIDGAANFDAYFNGHSHAYGRVLEMQPAGSGIGTGIPFVTIGNSGKVLDALNYSPYGTDPIVPLNYNTFIGYDTEGKALFNTDLNDFDVEEPFLKPFQLASPATVGLSGFYAFSKSNYPPYGGAQDPIDPKNPRTPAEAYREIQSRDGRTFRLNTPVYLSHLTSNQSDLSGLYGFGSGAAQLDVGDSYLMLHYQTALPLDPAILLIGRNEGVTEFSVESLFYQQWSPASAQLQDLGLFCFDIDQDGSLTNVQVVQSGSGYFESDSQMTGFLDIDKDFEIFGNNPAEPLGYGRSDPTRALVRLSFRGGRLENVVLLNKGSGYQALSNAIRQNNTPGPTADPANPTRNDSLLVGINIDLEAQYTLAAPRPAGAEPYHDWYLITETDLVNAEAMPEGTFGAVSLSLQPRSTQAREILASTKPTTGYNNLGPQSVHPSPQAGHVRLIDASGSLAGEGNLINGVTTLKLDRLPGPGDLSLTYSGDQTSSYQVAFRGFSLEDHITLQLNYGSWSGPLIQQGLTMVVSTPQFIQVLRNDSGLSQVTLGLQDGPRVLTLASQALGANPLALRADDLFSPEPDVNWQSSEGSSQGAVGSAMVAAGHWRPTAVVDGVELELASLQVEANGAVARFTAGRPDDIADDVVAMFSLPATGSNSAGGKGVLTVRRLSGQANGLALYQADPLTGAVMDDQARTLFPGDPDYLQAALASARRDRLVMTPQTLPGSGSSVVFRDLPLSLDRNYAALLMVNGSENELISSFALANPQRSGQCLSLINPGRGISFAFEDRFPWQASDMDFNDLCVTLTSEQPTVVL